MLEHACILIMLYEPVPFVSSVWCHLRLSIDEAPHVQSSRRRAKYWNGRRCFRKRSCLRPNNTISSNPDIASDKFLLHSFAASVVDGSHDPHSRARSVGEHLRVCEGTQRLGQVPIGSNRIQEVWNFLNCHCKAEAQLELAVACDFFKALATLMKWCESMWKWHTQAFQGAASTAGQCKSTGLVDAMRFGVKRSWKLILDIPGYSADGCRWMHRDVWGGSSPRTTQCDDLRFWHHTFRVQLRGDKKWTRASHDKTWQDMTVESWRRIIIFLCLLSVSITWPSCESSLSNHLANLSFFFQRCCRPGSPFPVYEMALDGRWRHMTLSLRSMYVAMHVAMHVAM